MCVSREGTLFGKGIRRRAKHRDFINGAFDAILL